MIRQKESLNNFTNKLRALTPIYLATVGLILGVLALFITNENSGLAFGLASSSIAGAAGLAEPSNSNNKDDEFN